MPSYAVRVFPSGHQFLASSRQSLLKAGLESGLNLKYGCEGGNCGKCLARLIRGQTQSIRHTDFKLSEQQKADRFFLTCCHAAQSDVEIEAVEIGSVREIAEQQIEARVYKLQRLSDDVMSVYFKTPRSQPLSFLAGQHLTIRLNDRLQRNKSIASCPCDGIRPEIHVKFRVGDPFSEYVFNQLKKNDRVCLQGPWGDFTLNDDSNRPLILVAFNTGFASIKSLLEHAIALEKSQSIQLYWLLTPDHQAYQENYCRAIRHALDNFDFQTVCLSGNDVSSYCTALELIWQQDIDPKDADIFVTAPVAFSDRVEQQMIRLGISDGHWRIDNIMKL